MYFIGLSDICRAFKLPLQPETNRIIESRKCDFQGRRRGCVFAGRGAAAVSSCRSQRRRRQAETATTWSRLQEEPPRTLTWGSRRLPAAPEAPAAAVNPAAAANPAVAGAAAAAACLPAGLDAAPACDAAIDGRRLVGLQIAFKWNDDLRRIETVNSYYPRRKCNMRYNVTYVEPGISPPREWPQVLGQGTIAPTLAVHWAIGIGCVYWRMTLRRGSSANPTALAAAARTAKALSHFRRCLCEWEVLAITGFSRRWKAGGRWEKRYQWDRQAVSWNQQ
ncbi:unnamed protein product [Phaeothamnion confervicola]